MIYTNLIFHFPFREDEGSKREKCPKKGKKICEITAYLF